MKRTAAAFLTLTLLFLFSACPLALAAGETTEYRDNMYSFRYPSTWKQGVAKDGSVILELPAGDSAVLTFAAITDILCFTGDAEKDAAMAESIIAQYSEADARAQGKNTALNGAYEMIRVGGLAGFRAFGTWLSTGWELEMVILTGENHMVSFEFVGQKAIASEQVLLESVTLLGDDPSGSAEGFLRWEGERFSIDYPENYKMLDYSMKDRDTVLMFVNADDPNNLYMARTYSLDIEYSDDLAPIVAASGLPKSTNVEPNAVMVKVGDRNAAVIRGEISSGPMEFYVIGKGNTAVAVMFTGEESVNMAEAVLKSIEIN